MVVLLSAPTVLAQSFCKGDFTYDGDVDANDVTTFLEHFGRSIFSNPCPPDGPAPVAKTGQTTSYATGDNGDLETGVAWPNPRFTDNLDGTITDNLTGLIWLKDAFCDDLNGIGDGLVWNDAMPAAASLASGTCGLSDGSNAGDWRVPHYKELISLIDGANHTPALPTGHLFTRVQSSPYWSSTTYAGLTGNAWSMNMISGSVSVSALKSFVLNVWCVRGGH